MLNADMVACCVGGFVSVTFKSIMCILYVEGLLGVVCCNRSGQLVCAVLCHPVLCVCVCGRMSTVGCIIVGQGIVSLIH